MNVLGALWSKKEEYSLNLFLVFSVYLSSDHVRSVKRMHEFNQGVAIPNRQLPAIPGVAYQ